MSEPVILAIESSCDETAASIIKNGKILNNIIASQSIHRKHGGVVPELASRAHMVKVLPVVQDAIEQASLTKFDLSAIAFTQGPGLLGSLMVGCSFAKSLAYALDIPLIAVNHMRAHILAHFIDDPKPKYPFLCLTVSGGHTQIVLVRSAIEMEVIGQTTDDAVGEAFDKCAKIMGLPYPGGPEVDLLGKEGDPHRFSFPDTEIPGLNYSFSGIKTAFLYFLRDETQKNKEFIEQNKADICASIQHKLIHMLLQKLKRAVRETGIKEVAIAGGVSANSYLRKTLMVEAEKYSWKLFIPRFEYCTDNAAMIAQTAHFMYQEKLFSDLTVTPEPRLALQNAQ